MAAAGTLTLQGPGGRLEENLSSNAGLFCLYFSLRLSAPKVQNKLSENVKDKDKAVPSRDTGESSSPGDWVRTVRPSGHFVVPGEGHEARGHVTRRKFWFLHRVQHVPGARKHVSTV